MAISCYNMVMIVSCLVLSGCRSAQAARPLTMQPDNSSITSSDNHIRGRTHPNHNHHQQQQQQQQRSLLQFGGNVAGNIGPVVGAVAQGVDVGIDLAAPLVNAVASNVPIMVPSVNGLCMNGEPISPFKQHPDIIMCLVGNGAQVTNALFNAVSRLGNAAGGMFGGGYGYGR